MTTVVTNDKVIKAVVADENYGDDSALYESMGYVRKSVRASGLSRKGKAAKTDAVKKLAAAEEISSTIPPM